jgi:hypothetical protein
LVPAIAAVGPIALDIHAPTFAAALAHRTSAKPALTIPARRAADATPAAIARVALDVPAATAANVLTGRADADATLARRPLRATDTAPPAIACVTGDVLAATPADILSRRTEAGSALAGGARGAPVPADPAVTVIGLDVHAAIPAPGLGRRTRPGRPHRRRATAGDCRGQPAAEQGKRLPPRQTTRKTASQVVKAVPVHDVPPPSVRRRGLLYSTLRHGASPNDRAHRRICLSCAVRIIR